MCGAGVDAGAVYRLNLGLKKRAGILAYVWSAGQQLFLPLERLHLQIGGERFEASLVVVSKSRLYGGQLELTPNANLLRRQFEVVCFETRSPMRYAARLAEALAGMLGRSRDVVWRHGREVDLAPAANSDVYVQVDGELVGSLPARIRMGPERIRLLLPQRYCDRSRDKNQPTGAPSVG
jgi:diacylglycerol kinase family enzyme